MHFSAKNIISDFYVVGEGGAQLSYTKLLRSPEEFINNTNNYKAEGEKKTEKGS